MHKLLLPLTILVTWTFAVPIEAELVGKALEARQDGTCPAFYRQWQDTTPSWGTNVDLFNVPDPTDDSAQFIQLASPLPDEPTVDAKRSLEARGQPRVFEVSGYRRAYASCIGQWIYITPQGDLFFVDETSEGVGRTAEVDHIFELQLIRIILQKLEPTSALGGRTAADLYSQCTCGDLRQELINILNNPVNFWGVDRDVNRAKGQLMGNKNFNFGKFDAAHVSGFEKYMDYAHGAYSEIAGRVGNALEDYFGIPGLAIQFRNASETAWNDAVQQIKDYQTKNDQSDMTAQSTLVTVSIQYPNRKRGRVSTTWPDVNTCDSFNTGSNYIGQGETVPSFTWDNIAQLTILTGPFASNQLFGS